MNNPLESIEQTKILYSDLLNVRNVEQDESGHCENDVVNPARANVEEQTNAWRRKENIKVSDLELGNFLSDDGMGWILCSFPEADQMEAVMSNGPYFVNGKIIGMDKWSHNFSPTSLKGLTAPIWIHLPNLPLHCWDNINICRIASMVGKPYLIDGNMFQWGRREFGRVYVRINLDAKLPLGVWVEGYYGRFYQKIEYERVPSFCFNCGLIGHSKEQCRNSDEVPISQENRNIT
ncbi:uncharacterized protein LOC110110690 [Dendrobium catenatum]|uniref:uncharacterized protein LOC110110690 n=1 Tax=Dendrobium catenatum TaxID=906689 RepID=UPI00109FE594|nr:uncharacterized protein LOC110110690 [Dendrobium catenatum]